MHEKKLLEGKLFVFSTVVDLLLFSQFSRRCWPPSMSISWPQ